MLLQDPRTRYILISIPISIACLALAAITHSGPLGGSLWSYGFALFYAILAWRLNDTLLKHFLLFSISAGFTELIADAWLVNTNTLFYPDNEPMLYKSPVYMPFSWVVVLIQLGYIGYLIHQQKGLLLATIVVGIMGCLIIPFYEFLAIHAGWWHYENATKWGLVPKYIYIAEGILMISIPTLFDRSAKAPQWLIVVLGIIQGLVMLVASYISFSLFAK